MSKPSDKAIANNKVFVWIFVAICLILLVPLVAMQFTSEVNWSTADFIVMAALLLVASSGFVLVARKVARKYWIFAGVLFTTALLYVWAELAVGIFTNWGS